jgi:predicted DNA-binding transcriptional regulator YafY
MSHDTDKLIRQLSLVAFLMAERRPLTARDVQQNVEGYSEMSDEAFARRFYSDRAELQALGVPLQSQRDEYTGEELYTLRSEQYFLPPLELTDDELAALKTSLHLLEGKFAYAEPLRLALENLSLGRPGFIEQPTATARRVKVVDPDYLPDITPGRLSKLENAISKQRTIKFSYYSIGRDSERERTLNPYALLRESRGWYVVGQDLEDSRIKTFKVSRMRGDIKFATRRERDFRTPAGFDVEDHHLPPDWQVGEQQGIARIHMAPETAWWVERLFGDHGRVENDVFETPFSNVGHLTGWILRQDGRAAPLEPPELVRDVAASLTRIREGHEAPPPQEAPAAAPASGVPERPGGPVAPERFAILQALLAYLLAACGEERSAVVPAGDLVERFSIPPDQLEEHLSLLNLVNFGGGCYTVYAQLEGDDVRVDKELFGDTFRAAPRLTPLEARAIRLALEFVGPMIAAESHTPLDRVRHKLEETFGQFDVALSAEPPGGTEEERLVAVFSTAIGERRLVRFEYLKEGEEQPSIRVVEPYELERDLPHWRVHTWDRDRDDERSFRLDRMRNAELLPDRFEPRAGFETRGLEGARLARIWYSPEIARFHVERGAQPLTDGAALKEQPFGSTEWLVGEIFSLRGEAIVLEPEDLRSRIAERAAELAEGLSVAPLRATSP